ncbi:hypothetical protein J6590_046055, partial [Homalodisca vitripennis]
ASCQCEDLIERIKSRCSMRSVLIQCYSHRQGLYLSNIQSYIPSRLGRSAVSAPKSKPLGKFLHGNPHKHLTEKHFDTVCQKYGNYIDTLVTNRVYHSERHEKDFMQCIYLG